jgi:hypothetical protein
MCGEAAGSDPRWNTAYPTDDFRNFLHSLYTNARLSFQIVYSLLFEALYSEPRWCRSCFSAPHKGTGGTGGVAPLILNLSTRWIWVASYTPWLLNRRGTHRERGWVGRRAGLDFMENRRILLLPAIDPWFLGRPACSLVTVSIEPSWLHASDSFRHLSIRDSCSAVYNINCLPSAVPEDSFPCSQKPLADLWPLTRATLKTHILCPVTFFSKIRVVYEIMWNIL